MAENFHDNVTSLHQLETCLRQTIARVNETKIPVFVAVRGQPRVAIIDLDAYREIERLAEIGFAVEAQQQIEREEAEGTLVPWEVVKQELTEIIEEEKRQGHG